MDKKRIIGSVIGVVFAILFITIGFWKTLFIGICGLIGFYAVEQNKIDKDYVYKIFQSIISLNGEYLGIILGIIFAIMVLIIGFWKTLFIGTCGLVGYYLGKKLSNKEELIELLDRILPPNKM